MKIVCGPNICEVVTDFGKTLAIGPELMNFPPKILYEAFRIVCENGKDWDEALALAQSEIHPPGHQWVFLGGVVSKWRGDYVKIWRSPVPSDADSLPTFLLFIQASKNGHVLTRYYPVDSAMEATLKAASEIEFFNKQWAKEREAAGYA